MLKNISLGTYYPGQSLLHRLQARTKLLLLLWIVVCLAIAGQREWHFVPFIVMVVLLCISVTVSNISPRDLWRRMRLLVLLTVIGAIPILFSTQGNDDKTLYAIGPLQISYAFAREAALIYAIVVIAFFLFSLVPPLRHVPRPRWMRRLRTLLVITILAAIVFLLLTQNASAATTSSLGPLLLTRSGVWSLVSLAAVLLTLYAFSLLLTMTTSPVALIEGLTMLLSPLRRLRLPVDDFALMTLLALRFIPTLLEEVEQLTRAQTARGADISNGTIRERLQSLAMLFVPLIQGVLRRASELATALEARGYEVEGQQTRLHEKSLGRIDYAMIGVVVLAMVGAFLL